MADTNVLLRALLEAAPGTEDERQAAQARTLLAEADTIAVTTAMLCEFVWVAHRGYKLAHTDIVATIRKLCESERVVCDRPAVDAGLQMLATGADFADGVIAHSGYALGAETFCSFDRRAVRSLLAAGRKAKLAG